MNKHVVFLSDFIANITYAGHFGKWQSRRGPKDLKDMIGSQVIVKGGHTLINKSQTLVVVADIANVLLEKDGDELSNIVWPEGEGGYRVEVELTNIRISDWNLIVDNIVPTGGKKISTFTRPSFGTYENRVEID